MSTAAAGSLRGLNRWGKAVTLAEKTVDAINQANQPRTIEQGAPGPSFEAARRVIGEHQSEFTSISGSLPQIRAKWLAIYHDTTSSFEKTMQECR